MKVNKQFTIRWNHTDKSTFLYGTKLNFKPTETIFENVLMPSGIIIQEWKMLSTYDNDKTTPQLPILEKGQGYQFNFNYVVTPEEAIYFKIIFYRKNGTMIRYQIIKQKRESVAYPKDAYAYKIQMINAAATHLKFKNINIEAEQVTKANHGDIEISDLKNTNILLNVLNLVLEEPSTDKILPLSNEVIQHMQNVIVIRNWHTESLHSNLQILIDYLKKQSTNKQIRLIGYGPQSNELAKALNRVVQSEVYITSHRDLQLGQYLKTELNDLSNINGHAPYIYFNHETQSDELNIFRNILNHARYLKYLERSLINSEVSHETKN
ncbi:accessory Sec system protein Asp3 [Staphylococcus intermedius]|uniref:accessory Sec system protein Asp3 n=1 Tax=Staphylococcus intermedius TaxID=1285 RepID=UPI000BBC7CC7|nr:accessory Sec system protein Asp3 [Staphylococcus intermedius]PCF86317.1 accessory Sec system protein Asp3 [Staphylococcus intermedius]